MKSATTPEAIKAAVVSMTTNVSGTIQGAEVMEDLIVENWPGKRPDDFAVLYVALSGENFSEAVTLPIAEYGQETLIRHLEWGRP